MTDLRTPIRSEEDQACRLYIPDLDCYHAGVARILAGLILVVENIGWVGVLWPFTLAHGLPRPQKVDFSSRKRGL